MSYDLQQATTNVAAEMTAFKEFANEQYSDPQAAQLKLRLNNDLDRLLNHLNFLSGTAPVIQSNEPMFKPLKTFMGEPMELPKPVTERDLRPDEVERETYRDKVNRLYEQIDTIAVDGILNSYTLPEDVQVLRGVAKVAGVAGYEERDINEAYINDIIAAKAAKIAADKQQAEIDRQLQEQEPIGQKISNPDVQATEADATAAPEPVIEESETVTQADDVQEQAEQENKNTGRKSKSK